MRRLFIFMVFVVMVGAVIQANGVERRNGQETSLVAVQTSVKASNGQIVLTSVEEKPVTFLIYSIIGQLVKSVTVQSGETVVELPRGYYIVKCEKWTKQVIVK